MKLFDKLSMCLRNLWRRKMRTLLTMFGVVIGTCAIVVMVSLGVGMDQAQQQMLEGMGNLTLINVNQNWGMIEIGGKSTEPPKLDAEAVAAIRAIPHVKAATPMDYLWEEAVVHVDERYRFRGQIIGVDMAAMEPLGYTLESGRFPTKAEYKNAVIVGSKTAFQFIDTKRKRNNRVSPYPDQFGRIQKPFVDMKGDRFILNIGKQDTDDYSRRGNNEKVPTGNGSYPLKVAGMLSSEESAIDRDFDTQYAIYMDISRLQEIRKEYYKKNKIRRTEESSYNQIYVMADSMENVEAIQEQIKELGFEYWSLSSEREGMQKQTQTIQMILGGLAGISLLVAALGITNTMIMSIYERTREIGIMKVLGCVVGNIRSVFLMEAGCIGLLGGVLGVGASYGLSFLLNVILSGAMNGGDSGGGGGGMMGGLYGWNVDGSTQFSIIPSWLVAGALVFAICIGLVSGFYPANRAVKISALEAIKHE